MDRPRSISLIDSQSLSDDDAPEAPEPNFHDSSSPVPLVTPSNPCGSSSSVTTNKNKSKRKASWVWQHFEEIAVKNEDGSDVLNEKGRPLRKARHGLCGEELSTGDGTGHLGRHHHTCVKKIALKQPDIRTQMQLGKNVHGNVANFTYNALRAKTELVEYLTRAELPFTFVEKHDFTGMINRAFCPQFSGFSASTAKREVIKQFKSSSVILKQFFVDFSGKVCITSDMWSSKQKLGYLVITAHFIDSDWNLNKRIISFKMLESPHTGITIAECIYDELVEWGLTKKVLTCSLDNFTANDVAVERLKVKLGLPSTSVLSELFHVRCCAHVLNLVVQDGLQALVGSLDKIRSVVRNLNSSQARYQLYKKCCDSMHVKRKNINIDMPIRWNSTYIMLKKATEMRAVLDHYVTELTNSMRNCPLTLPTDHDWLVAEIVRDFLGVFESATKVFCGIYYCTVNRVIYHLVEICMTFQRYSNLDAFHHVLQTMKEKFDKYFGTLPLIFCLGIVLDPRLKFKGLKPWLDVVYYNVEEKYMVDLTMDNTEVKLKQIFELYKTVVVSDTASRTTVRHAPSSYRNPIDIINGLSYASSAVDSETSELQSYLDSVVIDYRISPDLNVLSWWKNEASRYPVLSIIARDILTVLVSTIASEAAFSCLGRIISEKRTSLGVETVEALMCNKDWQLADSRMQAAYSEARLVEKMKKMKLSTTFSWTEDSEPDE